MARELRAMRGDAERPLWAAQLLDDMRENIGLLRRVVAGGQESGVAAAWSRHVAELRTF
jgi:hypothetical protein